MEPANNHGDAIAYNAVSVIWVVGLSATITLGQVILLWGQMEMREIEENRFIMVCRVYKEFIQTRRRTPASWLELMSFSPKSAKWPRATWPADALPVQNLIQFPFGTDVCVGSTAFSQELSVKSTGRSGWNPKGRIKSILDAYGGVSVEELDSICGNFGVTP